MHNKWCIIIMIILSDLSDFSPVSVFITSSWVCDTLLLILITLIDKVKESLYFYWIVVRLIINLSSIKIIIFSSYYYELFSLIDYEIKWIFDLLNILICKYRIYHNYKMGMRFLISFAWGVTMYFQRRSLNWRRMYSY